MGFITCFCWLLDDYNGRIEKHRSCHNTAVIKSVDSINNAHISHMGPYHNRFSSALHQHG